MRLQPLSAWWVAACYLVLGLVIFYRRIPLGRVIAATAAVALCAWTAYSQLSAPRPQAAELHLLAVGAGQCAVLRTPSGQTYMLDAGSASDYDIYQQVLVPFCLHSRLSWPRQAFISHADADHYSALPQLIAGGRLRRVYLNDYFSLAGQGVSILESSLAELLQSLAAARVEIVRLRAGQAIRLDERTTVEVVWPPELKRDDLSVNDTSLVLRITCDDKRLLLAGDLDETGQCALAARPQCLAADALVVPHHGAWRKSLPDFFNAVNPRVVLVSDARRSRDELDAGDQADLDRLVRGTRRYYSTGSNGYVRLRFGVGRLDVETMR